MVVLASAGLASTVWTTAIAGRRHTPPPLDVPAEGAALCPIAAVDAARSAVSAAKGDLDVERALRTYDQAVATWVVCATVLRVPGWTVPPVSDPLASELLLAASAAPGSEDRINGAVSLREAFPEAVALLALEDLSMLQTMANVEPAMRLTLTAGRIGPWACPEFVRWHPRPDGSSAGVCTDQRSVESMALDALQNLARTTDPIESCSSGHWLCTATAGWARSVWLNVATVELPKVDEAPLAVPRWGRGRALEARPGWSVAVEPDRVSYRRRGAVVVGPDGLGPVQDTTPLSVRPADMEGDPVVYVRDDVSLQALARALDEAVVPRPVFAGQDQDSGALVELRMRWAPAGAPGLDAGPVVAVDVEPVGLVAAHIARDVDARATGETIWLRVHPEVRYADLVAVHGALVERHPDIFVSIRDPDAPDANAD